jgi:hypothetical protein
MSGSLVQNGFQVAAVDANPRASRVLLHTMLVGSAASVACPVWYASEVASPSALESIGYGLLTGFVVTLAPFVSFAAWGLATAERRSCKRAAQVIIFGASVSLTAVTAACATGFYVTLSDQLSGSAGVAIHAKGRWHDDGVGRANTCGAPRPRAQRLELLSELSRARLRLSQCARDVGVGRAEGAAKPRTMTL